VFREGRTNFLFSVFLILAFGLGHCGLIILAGTMGAKIQRWLDWDSRHHLSARFKTICGAVLIFVGLYLIYKAA
jgi:cytochrome c-type biogenesis protein